MRHSEHSEESKKGDIMSKKQEQIVEQNAEQEEVAENEVIEAPESITGEDIVDVVSEEQIETDKSKYRAKVSITYNNKQYMPDDILDNVEADTIHSLLKNGFIELV